MNKTKSPLCER